MKLKRKKVDGFLTNNQHRKSLHQSYQFIFSSDTMNYIFI